MSTAQMGQLQKILVAGKWKDSDASESFQSANPALNEMLPERFPISSWSDCEAILNAAYEAAEQLRALPPSKIAEFLEAYAKHIESNAERLVSIANLETALPIKFAETVKLAVGFEPPLTDAQQAMMALPQHVTQISPSTERVKAIIAAG